MCLIVEFGVIFQSKHSGPHGEVSNQGNYSPAMIDSGILICLKKAANLVIPHHLHFDLSFSVTLLCET